MGADGERAEVRPALLADLPEAVSAVVDAVMEAAPPYVELFGTRRGEVVRGQIDVALRTYLRLVGADRVEGAPPLDKDALLRPAIDAAFELGRNEADLGRGTETLMTAFRVGARTTWQSFARVLTSADVTGDQVAIFAEQLFDFIDQLSAAAVSGHEFQSSRFLRARDTEREYLARDLLAGREPGSERLRRADWTPPQSLAAVVAAQSPNIRVRDKLPPGSLVIGDDLPGELVGQDEVSAALVPQTTQLERRRLAERLTGLRAVLGPAVPTSEAARSFRWAARVWNLDGGSAADPDLVDVEDRLIDVLTGAEPAVVEMLRRTLLSPLDELTPASRARLEETLRTWLDYRGRHDLVAAAMHVHPQTVRYRIGQLQRLMGPTLSDPDTALALRLALAR